MVLMAVMAVLGYATMLAIFSPENLEALGEAGRQAVDGFEK
jgi:hypothetical protein